ncbi:MAG TPA: TPM domain-containing protein [Hyphomicrobiales bacterium]|nr:TPM domain-containing protein [Hyphomicrobiales bacterium]
MNITDADRLAVENAIAEAEKNTSGEIVAVIARASGTYYYVPYLWAAIAALIVPWPLIYWTWIPVQEVYLLQLAVFVALAALLHYEPLRFALVPRGVKRQRAHQRAMQQFVAQDIYTAPGHTGALLFVSVAERYAEIVVDSQIHAKVPDFEWESIIRKLTGDIGRGEAGSGLVEAIRSIGAHLAAHFPPSANKQNLLPNHLVMLDAE